GDISLSTWRCDPGCSIPERTALLAVGGWRGAHRSEFDRSEHAAAKTGTKSGKTGNGKSMTEFRSAFVAIIGRPNVGKSTLVNALLGQKIAAVSPKPQTTRKRQLGILTTDTTQLVFVDTPGIHNPRHKLGTFLNQEAQESLEGVDVILWLVDASARPAEEDGRIAALLGRT